MGGQKAGFFEESPSLRLIQDGWSKSGFLEEHPSHCLTQD